MIAHRHRVIVELSWFVRFFWFWHPVSCFMLHPNLANLESLGHLEALATTTKLCNSQKETPSHSMDSPIISRLFRQLFTHRPCQSIRPRASIPSRAHYARRQQIRCMASRKAVEPSGDRSESHWQQRMEGFPADMAQEYEKYPMVTADQLRGRRERPRRVKMLTRDFIEGIYFTQRLFLNLILWQIPYIIHHTGTFQSKSLFSHRANRSISMSFRMNRNSIV